MKTRDGYPTSTAITDYIGQMLFLDSVRRAELTRQGSDLSVGSAATPGFIPDSPLIHPRFGSGFADKNVRSRAYSRNVTIRRVPC